MKKCLLVALLAAVTLVCLLPVGAAAEGSVGYTVVRFRQNANNDAYTPYAVIGLTAEEGEFVTPRHVSYEGFVLNTSLSDSGGVVSVGEPLELRTYFDRVKNPVNFVPNGGTDVAPYPGIKFEARLPVPPAPVREGHVFLGWYRDAGLNNRWDFGSYVMPNAPLTLYAAWEPAEYTVTFTADGVRTRMTYKFGDVISKPLEPSKPGFTFTGWDAPLLQTMPAHDIQLNALFTANNYVINYYLNGEFYTSQTYACGERITPPSVPDVKHSTFTGWTSLPSVMPACNLEADGSTVPNICLFFSALAELLANVFRAVFAVI